MKERHMQRASARTLGVIGVSTMMVVCLTAGYAGNRFNDELTFENGAGLDRTITLNRTIDTTGSFFKPLGSNARTCETCHRANNGWSIRPETVQARFDATKGLDPIFLPVDGTNSPTADMSTPASRAAATTLLREKGLIRVGIGVPKTAEFELVLVDDPYKFASAKELSLFRRPLPTTNLRYLAGVMWDNRESQANPNITNALSQQAIDAVLGHAQGKKAPTQQQIREILDFERGLFTAQISGTAAGALDRDGAFGGPRALASQPYWPGMNDPFPDPRSRQRFDPDVFSLFTRWNQPARTSDSAQIAARKAIGRGERIFNRKQFTIANVPGLNDRIRRSSVVGTCSTCHNMPNVGSSTLPFALNTGLADGSRRTPDMPLYTLRNKRTGEVVTSTDPGLAMTTGKWADIGKFKVPSLRGIESRSPYMHNGFTGDFGDIFDFYEKRFNFKLSPQERSDIEAFLEAL